MVVHRRIVKLNVTPKELDAYNPPRGIIMLTLEQLYDDKGAPKNQAYVEFAASNFQPEEMLRKDLSDIRHHLGDFWRNRILEDAITYHPKSPKRLYRLEGILDHPLITGKPIVRTPGGVAARKVDVPLEIRRAADAAGDRHEVFIPADRIKSQFVISTQNNEPFWIKSKHSRQEKRRVQRSAEEVVEERGPVEEGFDYGTLDEG